MVVYAGLIRAARHRNSWPAYWRTEMAHVTRRHGMRRIAQLIGIVAGIQLLFGDVSGLAAVAVQVLQEGAVNSYSREQEHEGRHGCREDSHRSQARSGAWLISSPSCRSARATCQATCRGSVRTQTCPSASKCAGRIRPDRGSAARRGLGEHAKARAQGG